MRSKNKRNFVWIGLLLITLFLSGCYVSTSSVTTTAVATNSSEDVDTESKEKNTIELSESATEEMGEFVLSVSCGYGKYAKYGRDMGVQATIQNNGKDFTGELWVLIPNRGSSSQSTLFRKEFAIAAGEEKKVELAIPVIFTTGKLNVSIRDEKEHERAAVDVRVTVQGDTDMMYVGVLSDNYMDLSYLTDNETKTFFMEGTDFPEDKKSLDMLDIIVINDFNTGIFNENQYDALKNFVNEGGTLVLGTGGMGSKVLEVFQDDFLTGTVKGTSGKALKLGSQTKEIEKEILDITLNHSSIIYEENGTILMQEVNVGKGNIQLFTFDIGLSNSDWNMMGKHILSKITGHLSDAKRQQLNEELGGGNGDFYQLRNCLDTINTENVPSIGKYSAVLGIYLLLIGPLMYLVLKKLDKRHLTWVVVPGIAVIFSLTIYIMGADTRLSRPYAQYITFAHISNGIETEELTFSLTAPYNNAYKVTVPSQYDITVPVMNYYYDNYVYDEGLAEYDMSVGYGPEVTTLGIRNHGAFEPAYFSAKSMKAAEGIIESNISLKEAEDGGFTYTGTVTNHLGYDLENAVLVVDSHYMLLGTLADGETRQIDEADTYVVRSQDEIWNYGLLDLIVGGDPWADGRDNTRIRRYYALEYMINKGLGVMSKENYLLGFTEDSTNAVIEATGLKNMGSKIVTASIDVDYQIDENQEYIPCLDSYYKIVNGDFDTKYRYIYSEMVGLEVHFGADETITSISYPKNDNPENNTKVANMSMGYYGVIKAFNYETNEHDIIFESGKPAALSDVAPYLGEDNTMSLVFEVDEKARQYGNICMPVLSAIKEVE